MSEVLALTDGFVATRRLMSDYQVTLVNNKMSEFFVQFKGPKESEWVGVGSHRDERCGCYLSCYMLPPSIPIPPSPLRPFLPE